jgi:soluble lytic murein transglycosylase
MVFTRVQSLGVFELDPPKNPLEFKGEFGPVIVIKEITMGTLQHKITAIFVLLGVCFMSSAKSEESVRNAMRVQHAKELLGGSYRKSVVRSSEKTLNISEFVKETTRKFIPKKFKSMAPEVASTLVQEADRYRFDPVFLMAVIQNESSFNPKRVGKFGEIGLMQIKPDTAAWIADTYDLEYQGPQALYDPKTNIRIGAALLDKLRHQFDSESRLYLSAYNIGAKKVRMMVSDQRTPKEYVQAVMKRYIAFYSGLRVKGSSKEQGEAAWQFTLNLTKKMNAGRKIAEN